MTRPDPHDDAAEDARLLERWRAGDERAASRIVERHATALARFAASLGVRDGVEELVQDTFVRAFNALDGFRADSALRTWLFTIERRLILDRRRAARRERGMVDVEESDAISEYDALDGIVATETASQVRVAVGKLTRLQREVFLLRVQEGRSYREIADIVGSTEGATRVHYHHAMKAVKESLHVHG
ncbi:MAG: RNA polymerase sigma factor [Gemmatimonadaceae bacterium]|jgi:RNA polymerase sigma-70 factor (ECF subfamily)|nr:RNA polymerase sigma factor [Gemmatimonadaceae bacterium]